MILKPYPLAERPSLQLKVCAAGALIGKRREWGYQRKWEGNYLVLVRQTHTQGDQKTWKRQGIWEGGRKLTKTQGNSREISCRGKLFTMFSSIVHSTESNKGRHHTDQAFPVAAARTWKQSASTRHVRTLYVCFPRTLEGFPLQAFLSMTHCLNFCSSCTVTVVIFRHFLLTYLIPYQQGSRDVTGC